MKIKITVNKQHAIFSQYCIENNLDAVRKAIQDGLDLTQLWTCENYPLYVATCKNYVELARLLVENGMPLYQNSKFSLQHSESEELFKQAFVFGCIDFEGENAETCLALLDYVEDVNTSDTHCNPLTNACYIKPRHVTPAVNAYVNKVLEMGGNIDHPVGRFGTILHSVVTSENTGLIRKLISLSKDLDNPGDYGKGEFPPLYWAIYKGKLEVIEALAHSGANINFCMRSSKISMLDYLIQYRDENTFFNREGQIDRTIELLRKLGAKTYKELKAKK